MRTQDIATLHTRLRFLLHGSAHTLHKWSILSYVLCLLFCIHRHIVVIRVCIDALRVLHETLIVKLCFQFIFALFDLSKFILKLLLKQQLILALLLALLNYLPALIVPDCFNICHLLKLALAELPNYFLFLEIFLRPHVLQLTHIGVRFFLYYLCLFVLGSHVHLNAC